MTLFLQFLLGHQIGDYPLQTAGLVAWKNRSWLGAFVHATLVNAAIALVLGSALPDLYGWVVLNWVLHAVQDRLKGYMASAGRVRGFYSLVADQLLHILVIVGIVSAVQGVEWLRRPQLVSQDVTLVYVNVLTFIFWAVPIFEWEGARSWFAAPTGGGRIDRLWGGMERLAAMGALLVGMPWIVPVAFIPRLLWDTAQPERHALPSAYTLAKGGWSAVCTLGATAVLFAVR